MPAVVFGAEFFADSVVKNLAGFGNLIVHPHSALAQVSGPIGMARISSEVQDLGWGPYLQLAAMISIALGIFNFLPIPALDGGRGIFIIAEMLRGRPVDPEKEALVHVTGFALLMVLMVFVAYHDVATIVSGKAGAVIRLRRASRPVLPQEPLRRVRRQGRLDRRRPSGRRAVDDDDRYGRLRKNARASLRVWRWPAARSFA